MKQFFTSIMLALIITGCGNTRNQNHEEIVQTTESYLIALNEQDVDTLTNMWAEQAVYKNPISGALAEGKTNIRKEYDELFKTLGNATFVASIDSLEFPFENKAVARGTSKMSRPGHETVESPFKIIFIHEEGKWVLLNMSNIKLGPIEKNNR